MEFKEIQDKITKIFMENLKRDKIEVNDNYLALKMTEELGEFIQSYIVYKKQCRPEKYLSDEEAKKELSKELSDIIGLVFAISTYFEIDLEEALTKKWITKEWVKKKLP
jgi:NTP pyrophosphatase (non-canonical NTP hydrolase)